MEIQKQTISLEGLRCFGFHGVLPQEVVVGAWYCVDLELEADVRKAFESDSLNDTLDYGKAAEIVREEMERPSKLIEHVAGRILERIRAAFPSVTAIRLCVKKENPPVGGQCAAASYTVTVSV